jgi:hypothetical protein
MPITPATHKADQEDHNLILAAKQYPKKKIFKWQGSCQNGRVLGYQVQIPGFNSQLPQKYLFLY